jgi:membrane fusion protein (multidrug efflux system)
MASPGKILKHTAATLVTLIIFALIAWWVAHIIISAEKKLPTPKQTIPTVTLIPVSYHTIPQTITTYGTTTSPNSLTLKAQVNAQVTKILFKAGQHVKKGQLLFRLSSSDITNQTRKLKAQMETAKTYYDRLENMNKRLAGSVAEFQVIKAALQYQQDRAAYHESLVVDNVRSPIDGIVSDTNLSNGSVVTSGEELANVVAPASLQIKYQVPSQYADQIKVGQPTLFYPTNATQVMHGSVAYISPLLNAQNYNLTLRANFDNKNNLREHLFGRIKQIINPNYKTLAINQKLVQTDSAGFYVYGVDDKKIVKISFDAGTVSKDGLIEVVSGIKPNTLIIGSDITALSLGQTVKVAKK